jgi:protoporphyrinogen IX oxidase
MMVFIKALHIAAFAVWAGGLIALPAMLRRDSELPDRATVVRLHHFSRFTYDALVSPAAVIAIATGTALIFSYVTIGDWLFLKMMAVAGMGAVHMMIGRVLDQLEAPDARPTRWKRFALTAGAVVFVGLTFWFVLARPVIDPAWFPDWMLRGQEGELPLVSEAPGASSSSSSGIAMPT